MRLFQRGAALLLVSAIVVPGAVRAQSQPEEPLPFLQLGPLLVHPSLVLKETYSDNVYYSPDDTKSDFITSVMPGLTLKFPFRLHEMTLGASAEFLTYAEHSGLNTSPYQVFGQGDFSIGDRIKLKVGDTYQRNEETPLESPNGTSDVYNANAAVFSARYAFVDVSQLQVDYTRTNLDYVDSNYRTRNEDLVSAYLYYRVLPNTSAFLEYDFKNVAYDTLKERDNGVQSGLVGAVWEITESSKGSAKLGFLAKSYADSTQKDYSTWTGSVDLRHSFTDAATVRLLGKRDVNEGKQSWVRYYTTTGLYADLTYRFLDRLAGVIESSYSTDDFSNAKPGEKTVRGDKTAHVGLGLKYSFNSWVDFALAYGYSSRDSNIDNFDAIINTVTLKVTAYR